MMELKVINGSGTAAGSSEADEAYYTDPGTQRYHTVRKNFLTFKVPKAYRANDEDLLAVMTDTPYISTSRFKRLYDYGFYQGMKYAQKIHADK